MKRKTKLRLEKKMEILYHLLYKEVFGNCNREFDLERTIKACEDRRSEIRTLFNLHKIVYPEYWYDPNVKQPETIDKLSGDLDYISDRFNCPHRLYEMFMAPIWYDCLKNGQTLHRLTI